MTQGGTLLVECSACGRILKGGKGNAPLLRRLNRHQEPGPTTAGHDGTMVILWAHAEWRSVRAS